MSDKAELDRIAVDRVLSGEADAFEEIVVRWQRPLINLAYRYCRDAARAEEMAQDAFFHLFKRLDRWKRRDAAFSTWMFTVVTNLYRTEMRKRGPALVDIDAIPEPEAKGGGDPSVEVERAGLVRRALSALPPKYRDVLILFYFHDMSVADAAASLGIAEGTVKARLHRGRAMLEKKLDAHFGPLPQEASA